MGCSCLMMVTIFGLISVCRGRSVRGAITQETGMLPHTGFLSCGRLSFARKDFLPQGRLSYVTKGFVPEEGFLT